MHRHFDHPEHVNALEPRSLALTRFLRPPAQHSESLARAIDQLLSNTDLTSLDPLHTRDLESLPTNSYRVAGSPTGTGGSNGSLLDEAAATLDYTPLIIHRDPESLKEIAREYRERAELSLALEEAAIEYHDAVHAAAVIRRRIERRQAALRRKAERGRRRRTRGERTGR